MSPVVILPKIGDNKCTWYWARISVTFPPSPQGRRLKLVSIGIHLAICFLLYFQPFFSAQDLISISQQCYWTPLVLYLGEFQQPWEPNEKNKCGFHRQGLLALPGADCLARLKSHRKTG